MATNTAPQTEAVPQTFAQFLAIRDWPTILEHAKRLPDAQHLTFGATEGDRKAWIGFDLRIHHFTLMDDGDSRVVLTVDDANCDPAVLHYVQSHFAELLSPELAD